MNVDFIGQTESLPDGCLLLIEELFQYVINDENISNKVEITVSFVTNDEIQTLNKQYRNKNTPTDVLSFPLFSKLELDELDQSIPISLGDIVISTEQAKKQSIEYGHSLTREICFLAVHGLLHLFGYDHSTVRDEEVMFQKQNLLLEEFGLGR